VSTLSQIDSALDRGGTLTLVQAGKEKAGGVGWAVHFAGDQQIKWALDEDLRWARQALDGEIQEASPWRSRIIHAAWWPSALRLGSDALRSRRVVCFVDNAPSLYARQPEFYAVEPFVDKWIVRSRQAAGQFETLGIEAEWAPYCVDPKTFFRLPPNDADLQALRRQIGLPEDAYVIGNFHLDTAFTIGPDRPKWQKGPDIFAEIVRRVREAESRVCVLLAGPRRHWLRQRLKGLDVPVFFAGREIAGDDFASNILDRPTLNRLYNLLDLYLVCSRWEGGPHSILEACFSRTKVLSTRVGIAEDVLGTPSLFDTIPEAVARILEDIREGILEATCQPQYETVSAQNSPPKLFDALHQIYGSFPQRTKKTVLEATLARLSWQTRRLLRRRFSPPTILGMLAEGNPRTFFEFLYGALRQSGAFDLRNKIDARCGHYLVDAGWFKANDPQKIAGAKIVFVSENYPPHVPSSAEAIIVPSFDCLRERPRHLAKPLPLVIPPVLDGTTFELNVPVPQQLTSTVAGVAQAIRQLFVVLASPEDVRWLGFR
jgi:glycosyltransferase involved in cell wall biosynthesis